MKEEKPGWALAGTIQRIMIIRIVVRGMGLWGSPIVESGIFHGHYECPDWGHTSDEK